MFFFFIYKLLEDKGHALLSIVPDAKVFMDTGAWGRSFDGLAM